MSKRSVTPFAACALFAGLMLFASTAIAQVKVGILGGANYSTITSDDPTDVGVEGNWLPGLGFVVTKDFSGGFGIRAEPSYVTKGATVNVSEFGVTGQNVFEYSYIDLPVMATYSFDVGPVAPYATGGAVFSYLVGTEDAHLVRESQTIFADLDPLLNQFDLGATVGAGVSLPVGRSSVFIQGRYSHGFMNFSQSAETEIMDENGNVLGTDFVDAFTTKNRGILFSAGFMIPVGR